MKLNLKVCKTCINRHRKRIHMALRGRFPVVKESNGWVDADDERWDKGLIVCPRHSRIKVNDADAQKLLKAKCGFMTEHMVSQ